MANLAHAYVAHLVAFVENGVVLHVLALAIDSSHAEMPEIYGVTVARKDLSHTAIADIEI